MKRFYVSLLLLVFSVICIFAADEIKTLEVSAIVPVDYGVVFPDDALCIDRLYLALESAEGDRTFLSVNDSSVHAGLITEYPEGTPGSGKSRRSMRNWVEKVIAWTMQ